MTPKEADRTTVDHLDQRVDQAPQNPLPPLGGGLDWTADRSKPPDHHGTSQ
jgi:hypothetical protein